MFLIEFHNFCVTLVINLIFKISPTIKAFLSLLEFHAYQVTGAWKCRYTWCHLIRRPQDSKYPPLKILKLIPVLAFWISGLDFYFSKRLFSPFPFPRLFGPLFTVFRLSRAEWLLLSFAACWPHPGPLPGRPRVRPKRQTVGGCRLLSRRQTVGTGVG